MAESVFGPGFDMESYLARRSLEIRGLQDRALFKDVVDKLFLELSRHTQREYRALEERVFWEFQSNQNDYAIYIGLIDQAHYDATDPFLKPLFAADTETREVSLDELQASLESGASYWLYPVYFDGSYADVCGFEALDRRYGGVVKTDQGEHKATFSVSRNTAYLKKIEGLYHVFGANYRAWTTVCGGYLYKLFDVSLVSVESIGPKEVIQAISIDFEEFADAIRYHMIPLWNLSPASEKTSTYPEPCMDKTNYEHRIFAQRLDPDCQYLVTNTDVELTNIRRLNGDLIITCPEENPCQWALYRVNQRPAQLKYAYPVLSNQCRESFAGDLADMYRKSVKTRAEIARLIAAFGYESYVTFQGIDLLEHGAGVAQTYDMDAFISDELRVGDAHQVMELSFAARDSENHLNMDIMSFLVTQVQKLFPEYRCQGRLVQETAP